MLAIFLGALAAIAAAVQAAAAATIIILQIIIRAEIITQAIQITLIVILPRAIARAIMGIMAREGLMSIQITIPEATTMFPIDIIQGQ